MLRKDGSPNIPAISALRSIECVRYRGSKYGAGFAAIRIEGRRSRIIKVFADGFEAVMRASSIMRRILGDHVSFIGEEYRADGLILSSYIFEVEGGEELVREAVQAVNEELDIRRARVYSWGKYTEVFKGVGYPLDVYRLYDLGRRVRGADLWIAHTRQPTNSPGGLPIWSHPFASGEWAIAHNGDISSFGANVSFLSSVGYRSFVGTDSEVIAYLLDYLTTRRGLSIGCAAKLLCNQFEDDVKRYEEAITMATLRGARLDGPFAVVAGYCDGLDVYLLAFVDRSKFRPLVVGEDGERFYVASEEAEIRAISRDAEVWTIEPGGYFLASLRKGIINPGREFYDRFTSIPRVRRGISKLRGSKIDAANLGYDEINAELRRLIEMGEREITIENVNGQRYIGVGVEGEANVRIYGTPGNCLANLNQSLHVEVFGNVQDDVGDTMHGGSVVVHGDARDVLGQALQGGYIYVAGNAGNRCGIQMREYADSRPAIVIGGRVDDYLGEYMAGGILVVLGLNYLGTPSQIAGRFIASGMVGGTIYIRGRVERRRIGLNPSRMDVERYIEGLYLDGIIGKEHLEAVRRCGEISLDELSDNLPIEAISRLKRLYENKYSKLPSVETRRLTADDLALIGEHLQRFASIFDCRELLDKALEDEFTVIRPARRGVTEVLQAEEG